MPVFIGDRYWNMRLAAIDYSMTSPAICVYDTKKPFTYENCSFYSCCDHKIKNFGQFNFVKPEEWTHPFERYNNLAAWAYGCTLNCDSIGLEGYSMGSKGLIFNIAENTAVLKNLYWMEKQDVQIFPPTVVKKVATGKGNANKDAMYEAWLKETGFDLKAAIQPTRKLGSPTSDLVDAFFICKALLNVLV